jgi:hypothetical protein
VDPIIDLFTTVLKIAVFGGFVLFVTNILKFKKFSNVKSEILNLQAKISQLRLALKGKVKKKSNIFRGSLKAGTTEGDMVDNALKSLCENNFECGDDFQAYFDASRKIVNYIQIQSGEGPTQTAENNFMCGDFKTEMDIVRIIKELSTLSAKVNSRIDDYNRINANQKMPKVDSLIFPSLAEIGRIFNEDDSKSKKSETPSSGDSGQNAA